MEITESIRSIDGPSLRVPEAPTPLIVEETTELHAVPVPSLLKRLGATLASKSKGATFLETGREE